ncbi:hypothetical protein ACSSS7_002994 [Eimeria intestinalis]
MFAALTKAGTGKHGSWDAQQPLLLRQVQLSRLPAVSPQLPKEVAVSPETLSSSSSSSSTGDRREKRGQLNQGSGAPPHWRLHMFPGGPPRGPKGRPYEALDCLLGVIRSPSSCCSTQQQLLQLLLQQQQRQPLSSNSSGVSRSTCGTHPYLRGDTLIVHQISYSSSGSNSNLTSSSSSNNSHSSSGSNSSHSSNSS